VAFWYALRQAGVRALVNGYPSFQDALMPRRPISPAKKKLCEQRGLAQDEMLLKRRAEIEKQLERMGNLVGGARIARDGRSTLKGTKVPPKYRSPSAETWAGRGAKPRWLVAAIKGGRKIDDFLIDKRRRKRRSKR
jgi:DNA-binding protein H-NS